MDAYEHDGRTYYWSGTHWFDENFVSVCAQLTEQLSKLVEVRISSPVEAARLRHSAKESGQVHLNFQTVRAILADRQLKYDPVLVGLLRDQGRQTEALRLTHDSPQTPALSVARAACWADLGEWQAAVEEAARAKLLGAGPHADAVMKRVLREMGKVEKKAG